MVKGYEDRVDCDFNDIITLSKPINSSKNYLVGGGVYGIEKSLKEYCGFPKDYFIKAFIEHGATFSQYLECGFRVHESLPTISMSPFRSNLIKSIKNNNGAYAIGPFINYSKPLLDNENFNLKKEKLGSTLLVFPAHSTLGGTSKFSVSDFCERIKELSTEFDSVLISLYWKDVEIGRDEIYKKYGFNVVTAGYMYDSYFLSRLKSIIELSDMTIANEIGTASIYSLSLNKPHIILPMGVDYDLEKNDGKYLSIVAEDSYNEAINLTNENDVNLIKSSLLKSNGYINSDNEEIINKYSGIDCIKSRTELKEIFLECEEQFSQFRYYLKKPLFFKEYFSRMFRISKNLLKK